MKMHRFVIPFLLSVFISSCSSEEKDNIRFREKDPPVDLYEMVYESANWIHPEYKSAFTSLGNHRILLDVDDSVSGYVQVNIPWRRPDINPTEKAVIILEEDRAVVVKSTLLGDSNNEFGHIVFETLEGASRYYVYYLPHRSTGSYYPKLNYISPEDELLKEYKIDLEDVQADELPRAHIICAQSIDDFHSFFPMEVSATASEVSDFMYNFPSPYYLFPEYREHPVKMTDQLPQHWISGVPANGLSDTVLKGEYYTYQISLWSMENDLKNVEVKFNDLHSKRGVIPQSYMTCFNIEGKDLNGDAFTKVLSVEKAKVQALWCGIDIPTGISHGTYNGEIYIQVEGYGLDTVYLKLHISKEEAINHGDNNPEYMSRLRWLNSTIGNDHEYIARPYIPVKVKDHSINILGREIEIDQFGFPASIYSYFTQEMTSLSTQKENLLTASIRPEVLLADGELVLWNSEEFHIEQEAPVMASWSTTNSSESLLMNVSARIEYDGMMDYNVLLIAKENVDLEDYILNIPIEKKAAEYMLGLGYKGGKRPEQVDWKWDVASHHQEGAWLGTINKGLQYVLRDENYERPLNTNFYRQKPLIAPTSWYNDGKGGIRIHEVKDYVAVENYSGSRQMKAGDTLYFNMRFLITPFKLVDTKAHFNTRFVHKYVPVDSVVAWNGTIINVHHANEINPYINYPFYNISRQKAYIDEAHRKGIKVKLYNTIRELTYKAHELFALRSLGGEILNDGKGGGHSWLQEHLRTNYHSAWHATSVNDAAILNKGNSRWTNYYIEGVNWLAEHQQIDGLYLDDIAFSRNTVKRLANVLNKHRSEVIIDLHSANQFNERDGFLNSAFLYMEHMPYISRLWFGEYFEYDLGPDYWLTEVSGIPFGLTGEMLEGGGHPWRGLVYGMTSRIYGNVSPEPIWDLFDDYRIPESDMLGYWVDRSPIKTDIENIRSTIYLHEDHVLIAIGSWSEKDEMVPLHIDWNLLGIDKSTARMYSPEIEGLQEEREFKSDQPVPVEKGQGMVLVLEK